MHVVQCFHLRLNMMVVITVVALISKTALTILVIRQFQCWIYLKKKKKKKKARLWSHCGKSLFKVTLRESWLLPHLLQGSVNTWMMVKRYYTEHPSCSTELYTFWPSLYGLITQSQIVLYCLLVYWLWPRCSHSTLISQALDLRWVNYFAVLTFR